MRVEEAATKREQSGNQVLGVSAVLAQQPLATPKNSRKSPAPLFHAATKAYAESSTKLTNGSWPTTVPTSGASGVPTAAARRQGREAVLLEQLCFRDGLSLDEAVGRMRTEHEVSLSRTALERMAASLTRRPERRRISEDELLRIPVDGQVEVRIDDAERSRTEEQLRLLLPPLLQSLAAEDRLLLKLHYWDGLSMAAISPLLRRSQRKLYSVRDKCLKKIRRNLEAAGLNPERVRALLGCSHLDLADGI